MTNCHCIHTTKVAVNSRPKERLKRKDLKDCICPFPGSVQQDIHNKTSLQWVQEDGITAACTTCYRDHCNPQLTMQSSKTASQIIHNQTGYYWIQPEMFTWDKNKHATVTVQNFVINIYAGWTTYSTNQQCSWDRFEHNQHENYCAVSPNIYRLNSLTITINKSDLTIMHTCLQHLAS